MITTTVVGNYPKIPPRSAPNLRTVIARYDTGRVTPEELRRAEEQNTLEIIQEQVEAGVELVTDGQVHWEDGQTYFARAIRGFSINGLIRYFDTNTYYRQPIAEAALAWQGPISVADYRFALRHSRVPVKAVVTGPYTLARLSADRHYGDLRKLTLALAEVLNQEALALQEAGTPLIQFDEPAIVRNKGDFPLFQEAMARLVRGLTAKTALYTYFGDISGLYPDLFKLPLQVFGLDFVWGTRNFEVVKDFPSDKELGFGILDARNTRLEPVEELVETIRRVARVVPPQRLYLNPSCGLEFLPRDRAYNKLVRLVEGAKAAREVLA